MTRRTAVPVRPASRRLLDVARLLVTGSASSRTEAQEIDRRLRQPLSLSCRSLIIPTGPRTGTSTVAIQLAALLTRSRALAGLLLDASEHPRDPSTPVWPLRHGSRPPTTAAQAHDLVGITPANPLGRLRLPTWRDACPQEWEDVRARLFRFHDTVLTETAPLRDADLLACADRFHSIVLVSRAARADVEAARERIAALADPLSRTPRRTRALHAVVATEPGPVLIPRLHRHEVLIPFDTVLARTRTDSTAAPGLIERPTGVALARLAASLVDAAGPREGP